MNLIPLLEWWYGGAWAWFVIPALVGVGVAEVIIHRRRRRNHR